MFRRQIELIGEDNQQKLSKKSVLIVGCGGLGNIIASTISCIGLKEIYLVDFDKIEEHNLHRQFNFTKEDVGESKRIMLSRRVDRCEDTKIVPFNEKFDKNFNLEVDLVFDATDNFEVRKEIDEFSKKRNIPWVYASVEEFRGQVGLFKRSSFDIFATTSKISKGQFSPMVNLIGSIASMVGIKELINPQNEHLYYIDFSEELSIKKFYL